MAWVKLDDQFFAHPKIVALSKDAQLLFLSSLTYAAAQLTDGELSAGAVRIAAATVDVDRVAADELVQAGLWETCGSGYLIHDYLDYQPSRERVMATREARAEAGSKGGKQKASNTSSNTSSKLLGAGQPAATDNVRSKTLPRTPTPVLTPVLDANASRTGGGEAASEPKPETTRSKARDRGWEILVGFAGYEPKTKVERNGWNGVLKRLRSELHITDDDLQAACDAYESRWPEMEKTPYALEKHYQRLRETKRASPNGHAPPSDEPAYEVFDIGNYLRSERPR